MSLFHISLNYKLNPEQLCYYLSFYMRLLAFRVSHHCRFRQEFQMLTRDDFIQIDDRYKWCFNVMFCLSVTFPIDPGDQTREYSDHLRVV